MARRITILGMGPTSNERRHDIERYCEGTEIWSLNNAYLTFPKLTAAKKFARFFELHSWQYLQTWEAGKNADGSKVDHWARLDSLGCPVYVGQDMPYIKNQKLVDWLEFGQYWNEKLFSRASMETDTCRQSIAAYFMGSPSTILALALMEHDKGDTIEFIQSWGIDTGDPQHLCQRAAWSFWISQALSRGIEIGGTACGYMLAYENDAGLQGLREMITNQVRDSLKTQEIQP